MIGLLPHMLKLLMLLCDIHLLRKLADFKGAKLFLDATASINLEKIMKLQMPVHLALVRD